MPDKAAQSTGGWPRWPLRYLLPAVVLIFGFVLISFQVVFLYRLDVGDALQTTTARCERTGSRLGRLLPRPLRDRDASALGIELGRSEREAGINRVVLVGVDGTITSAQQTGHLGQPGSEWMTDEIASMVHAVLSTGTAQTSTASTGDRIIGVFPIGEALPKPEHVVVIDLDLASPLRDARKVALTHAVLASLALLLACAALWAMLDQLITKRVTSILRNARALIAGQPGEPALSGEDELAVIDSVVRESHALIKRQAGTLRAQEKRYRTMVESLPAMVFISRDNMIEYMNQTGLTMLGLKSMEEIKGRSALDFIPECYHARIKARSREVFATGGSVPPEEEEIRRADGTTIAMETVASYFTDARGPAIQVVMHDVSERKAAEARREALGREISNASEREQRRIGQDLHDDICQRLAAVKMSMQDLEESIAEHAPALMDEADEIVDRLTDAIGITRGLARGLSPVDIEAGGLGVALAGLVRSARQLHGIECELVLPDELPALAAHSATQIYRIAQECITNAVRHGRASHITVCLALDGGHLVLRVANNGLPMPENSAGSQGMGLHIMRHRAASIAATLEFETHPADASVAVRCDLPLEATANPALAS